MDLINCCCDSRFWADFDKCIGKCCNGLKNSFYSSFCINIESYCLKVLKCSVAINFCSECFQAYWAFQGARLNTCLQCCPHFFVIYLGYNGQSNSEEQDNKKEKKKNQRKK